jgi:hypothetical protein
MIFSEKYRPRAVDELVFAETHVRDLVINYARYWQVRGNSSDRRCHF